MPDRLEEVVRAMNGAGIRPIIDRVFTFADARQALEHLQAGGHIGKIVIKVSD